MPFPRTSYSLGLVRRLPKSDRRDPPHVIGATFPQVKAQIGRRTAERPGTRSPERQEALGPGASSRSSQPRNASRLRVDPPRATRQAHSLRIDEAKPSSRIVLKDSSAYVSTEPSNRSS